MFTRRSGRLNQSYSANLNQSPSPGIQPRTTCSLHNQTQTQGQAQANTQAPTQAQTQPQHQPHQQSEQQSQPLLQCKEQPQPFHQQRYFNSPQIQELLLDPKEGTVEPEVMIRITESPDQNASATTKALNQMESDEKKKWKKGGKIPMGVRRKKLNQRLSKLLTPKSALILLHELKPGCVYKVQEQPGCIPPSFYAQVEHENVIIGSGQGLSKSQAKNCAAENAIKTIVSRTMSRHVNSTGGETEKKNVNEDGEEDTPENLPWAGLASFAIYKMFSEWQTQGADLLSITRPLVKPKSKSPNAVNAPAKKELPPNAAELHPAVVLNMMNPGLTAVEIEREDGPKCRVKMGYLIEGQMYTGIGGNKKDAKKEAAKAVLEGHYRLTYA